MIIESILILLSKILSPAERQNSHELAPPFQFLNICTIGGSGKSEIVIFLGTGPRMSETGFLKEKPHGPTGVASAGQEN